MNKCFLFGNLESDINFSFTLKKKPISIATFYLKLLNNTIIKIYTFDENADFCYRKLRKNQYVFLEGKLNSEYNVIVENIYKVCKGDIARWKKQ